MREWCNCYFPSEELVDGAALLDLTEEDVKGICKKIGPTKNICRFICQVSIVAALNQICFVTDVRRC